MVFKYDKKWILYEREVRLSDGSKINIYFFSTRVPKRGNPSDLPEGYSVGVNKRTGLPYVKKR